MSRRTRQGFTLIEIMAVVLILGLTMTLLLPAIGAGGGSNLRRQGERLAGTLELARQRAIVTGKPHRVVIDLHEGGYAIEWLVSPSTAEDPDAAPPQTANDVPADGPIDLAPPIEDTPEYHPIPNRFGGFDWLEDGFFFEGVDTPEGWIERGEVFVSFDWDGSSDPSQIVISDPDNRSILLDVLPMLEQVRIREESS